MPAIRVVRGVTLIEILVVIAVVAIVAGVLFPAIQQARMAAAEVQCSNNLRQTAIALTRFRDVHSHYPPGGVSNVEGWAIASLEYAGLSSLREQFANDDSIPTISLLNRNAAARLPSVYWCAARRPSQASFISEIPSSHFAINEDLSSALLSANRATHMTPMVLHLEAWAVVPWVNNPVVSANERGLLAIADIPRHRRMVAFEDCHVDSVISSHIAAMPE